jgi:hypothetical protein
MKKYMLVSLVIAFLLVTVGGPCFAGTVANTSKKGSLLIFPLIRTDTTTTTQYGVEQWETLISIGNDNAYSVHVQCVFVTDPTTTCDHFLNQFDFELTANMPVTFRASDGKDLDGGSPVGGGIDRGHVAELKCWVVGFQDSNATTEMSYNHLTGEATLLRTVAGTGVGAATYNAWRFAANAGFGTQVGAPGNLVLSGANNAYDGCPGALIFDYLKQTPEPLAPTYISSVDNYVAMVPCKQDLTQSGGPAHIKVDVQRRNESEQSQNGFICLDCFFANSLDNVPYFPDLDTAAGAFKAYPYNNCSGGTLCNLPAGDTYPLVGVIVKRFNGYLGPITATTPTGEGEWVSSATECKGVPAIKFNQVPF